MKRKLLKSKDHLIKGVDTAKYLYEEAGAEVIKKAKMYGEPWEHFSRVAEFWSLILKTTVKPSDVCRCMIALKDVRQEFKANPDNILDHDGYSLLMEMMINREEEDHAKLQDLISDLRTGSFK